MLFSRNRFPYFIDIGVLHVEGNVKPGFLAIEVDRENTLKSTPKKIVDLSFPRLSRLACS